MTLFNYGYNDVKLDERMKMFMYDDDNDTQSDFITQEVLSRYNIPSNTPINQLPANVFSALQLALMEEANDQQSRDENFRDHPEDYMPMDPR